MLSDQSIENAKREYSTREQRLHEHNDCVRIAYEWLDAQKKLAAPNTRLLEPVKHIIEAWGGRYVSQSDVELAAYMHPDVTGRYPGFNISSRLTLPNDRRLHGISEAGKHPEYRKRNNEKTYSVRED
jgi:hypothetical protein